MKRNREIIFYENHFNDFYNLLNEDVKEKVDEVLYLIMVIQQIPKKFFDSITGVKGLFEIRVEFKSNIYRIFCCFDKGNLVVLFNGFQKKTNRTPKNELEKAESLKQEYFDEQRETK